MDHQNINAKMESKSMQIGSSMLVQYKRYQKCTLKNKHARFGR